MPKEKQVASLELSQKLKELGYPQESLFYWRDTQGRNNDSLVYKDSAIDTDFYTHISAPTVAELGMALPGNDGEGYYLTQKGLLGNSWFCTRCRIMNMEDLHQEEANTEADARAKMLIYLLENKLIEL